MFLPTKYSPHTAGKQLSEFRPNTVHRFSLFHEHGLAAVGSLRGKVPFFFPEDVLLSPERAVTSSSLLTHTHTHTHLSCCQSQTCLSRVSLPWLRSERWTATTACPGPGQSAVSARGDWCNCSGRPVPREAKRRVGGVILPLAGSDALAAKQVEEAHVFSSLHD